MTQDPQTTGAGDVDRLVRRAVGRLSEQARGEVLLLGHRVPVRLPACTAPPRHLDGPDGLDRVDGIDTVLSVCELWRPHWDEHELGRLARRLRPGGRLLFVEPVAVTGASRVVQRLARPALERRLGFGFDRDLAPVLRSIGLPPGTLDRLTADRWGRVRCFVAGVATHFPQAGRGGCP